MREDYLNKYLSDNQLSLVFYSLGEKYVNIKGNYQIIGPRHDLSGAYCYEKLDLLQKFNLCILVIHYKNYIHNHL